MELSRRFQATCLWVTFSTVDQAYQGSCLGNQERKRRGRVYTLGSFLAKSSTKIGGQVRYACFLYDALTSLGADAHLTDPRDPIATYL
jgi:hypothetical protein